MVPTIRSPSANLWLWLRELFTLQAQERSAAAGLSPYDRTALRHEMECAVTMMREAGKSSVPLVRAHLSRQALANAIVATARARLFTADSNDAASPDVDSAIQKLSSLSGWDRHRSAIARLAATDILTDSDYRRLADFFAYVERLTDLRSPRDFWTTRWLRRSGLLLLLVGCTWLAVRPRNLARGKMVTMSSSCPEIPIPVLGLTSYARAVDGIRIENSFAICTNSEAGPWVTVDLGAPYSIEEVVTYPLTDGPWGKTDIPQQIRLSLDNEHFEVAGVRDELYTTDFPWRLDLPKRRAQYVQIIGSGATRQKLILNEIEVYGR